jgi:hypothetical protein
MIETKATEITTFRPLGNLRVTYTWMRIQNSKVQRVDMETVQFAITMLGLRKEVSWIGPLHISFDVQLTFQCSPPII